jgi:hypothetical protein
MNNYGFIRAAAAVPAVRLADVKSNVKEICRLITQAVEQEVSIIAFPELSLTGATCGDLFAQETLLKGVEEGIKEILEFSIDKRICIIVGAPVRCGGRLHDCAVVIKDGEHKIPTERKKVGAMLGDFAEIGCGCVLNPGTVVGPRTQIYPLTSVRGVIPADSICKDTDTIVPKK